MHRHSFRSLPFVDRLYYTLLDCTAGLTVLAGNIVANASGKVCVGLSLNTNHLKSVKEGYVYATAKPIHLGRSTQVWEVDTKTEDGTLINVCRMTLAVIDRK